MNTVVAGKEQRRTAFYNPTSESDKAEFINEEVTMHAQVKLNHYTSLMALSNLMYNYCKIRDLGQIHVEKLMIQLTQNSYEPDYRFFKKEKAHKLNFRNWFYLHLT